MKRRKFIRNISLASAAPFVLNGIPLRTLAQGTPLGRIASSSTNDRVLVLIQLHGGNDGLNTLVPMDQYDRYYNIRPNVALPQSGRRRFIPLDSTMPGQQQSGLHPDMTGFKQLYDYGRAAIIQNVAYENINGSHFRSRDIWFMGGGYNDYYGSGWVGRYLNHLYPGYPDNYPSADMEDPLALEVGNTVSLAFHRDNGIPTAISIRNPEQFYNLINSVGVEPPESVTDTHYGDELKWILDIEEKGNEYAGRLREVYENGDKPNRASYPEAYPFVAPKRFQKNPLSGQLRMIAQLLAGGSKTKVFLARIGGFDTHAQQVEPGDATMGAHAALLYHISEAMRAFQDDLRILGLEDRVMSVTFSEFGRRAFSNGSYGTDHGTSAPMMVFGKHVKAGIYGNNPDLNNLQRGNLANVYDYRQVFTALLQDWLGASDAAIDAAYFTEWQENRLELVNATVTSTNDAFRQERFHLKKCYPNPAARQTVLSFRINNTAQVNLQVLNQEGRLVKEVVNSRLGAGDHSYTIMVNTWPAGLYLVRLVSEGLEQTQRLMVSPFGQ